MKKEENLKTSRQKHSYLENEYIENVAKQRKFTNKKQPHTVKMEQKKT